MATYYVRKTGSDANAGTSAGAAWLTLGKALGAAGIASGDTVYVGAGVYRETPTVAMTSATAETRVVGDVDGSHTGDAGEVMLTAYTANDIGGVTSGPVLGLGGRDFLTFENITFVAGASGSSPGIDAATTLTSTDITFRNCSFLSGVGTGVNLITVGVGAGVAANWLIERCRFMGQNRNVAIGTINVTLTRHTVDYNANVTIRNCTIIGGNASTGVRAASTGAGAGFGGGVTVDSCSIIGSINAISTGDAFVSTTFPLNAINNFIYSGGTAFSANVSGQITESFNFIAANTARTNVAIGAGSVVGAAPLFHFGQEAVWDGQARPFGAPTRDSPLLGFGATSGPSVDLLNRPRAAGGGRVIASGTATAGSSSTLTDSGAAWGTNALNGAVARITNGTGFGQAKIIKSHTGTVITFYSDWATIPDSTSTYIIYTGAPAERGKVTGGAATTLTDSSASWPTNLWAGYIVEIIAGTGNGQTATIASNTATALTVPTWGTNPDNTSRYRIYRQTSPAAVNRAAGALERHDTAEKETTTTDAGSVAMRLTGYADHRILVPVDATSTTISIRARYDANHAATNKPQAVLIANGEIGVTTETKTMTAAADTWETLTFAAQTPTAKGWVTIELRARADVPYGKAFFDTEVAA